jgi:hypothetical protein
MPGVTPMRLATSPIDRLISDFRDFIAGAVAPV